MINIQKNIALKGNPWILLVNKCAKSTMLIIIYVVTSSMVTIIMQYIW
jgi:hypothetical protein